MLFLPQLFPELKGERPAGCGGNNQEIANGMRCHMAAENGVQNGLCAFLDQHDDSNAKHEFEQLRPPDRACVIVRDLIIQNAEEQHTENAAQHGVRVFECGVVIRHVFFGKYVRGEGVDVQKDQKCHGHGKHAACGDVDDAGMLFIELQQQIKAYDQNKCDCHGNQHVLRRVYAEIHTRKGNQYHARNTQRLDPYPLCANAQRAKHANAVLRVTAGEGITARSLARRFHDREIRILDPGAGHTEEHFQELVDDNTRKADHEYKVAVAFIAAPDQKKTEG